MDAFVSHNVLIVDLAADGNYESTIKVAKLWRAANKFFSILDADPQKEKILPRMASFDAAIPSAKVGYANMDDGEMKFLETRLHRKNGTVIPMEIGTVVEDSNVNLDSAIRDAFQVLTNVGKNVIRIAIAASSVENGGFEYANNDADTFATKCAAQLAEDLVDDGTFIDREEAQEQSRICMSPQRLCHYSNKKEEKPMELFGAHTDSSFVTIVPVGAMAGLEVYDEDAQQWYRPELKARKVWEQQELEKNNGQDASNLIAEETLVIDDEGENIIPWHARYVVIMPGEFLQILSRDKIAAAVHRVVVAGGSDASRISAPLLLRGRPGIKINVEKYLGRINGNNLLKEVDGLYMQDIHNAMNQR